jgi:Dyp-type peroxidase family
MAGDVAQLELGDIQGDILRAYGNEYERTSYLFVGIGDPARGRGWLGGLVDRVTTAEQSGEKTETHLNLAVTHAGLEALGAPERLRLTFSEEFRQGMAGRAERLGDTGQSSPSGWDAGLGTGAAHLLVTINAKTTQRLDEVLTDLRTDMQAAGVREVAYEAAHLLPGAREHFGFADGSAQPAVQGVTDHKTRGGGVPEPGGRWRPLAPGEFIFGYPDEDTRVDPQGRLPSGPGDPLGRNGTYMVYRKLYQDVALFRRTLGEAARLYDDGDAEKLAAKVVGRWQNGTPLEQSPEAPDPNFDPNAPGANDFRYLDHDADGHRCPLGAHIRRSNPRDALGWKGLNQSGLLSFRHRIIRRGMPYGLPLPEGETEDDRKDRGLVFVCFNASISRQFEGIQIQWLNAGNAFGLGHDSDFLLGDSRTSAKMTVQGSRPFFLSPPRAFVVTRGGEYLFMPGIRALRALADGIAR